MCGKISYDHLIHTYLLGRADKDVMTGAKSYTCESRCQISVTNRVTHPAPSQIGLLLPNVLVRG